MDDLAHGILSRRQILAGGAGAVLLSQTAALAQSAAPIVKTRSGLIRGRVVDNVNQFLGVPYGANTEGQRFLPPRPVEPWTGIRDTIAYGPQSPQDPGRLFGPTVRPTPAGRTAPSLGPLRELAAPRLATEECLNLNVYAPKGAARGSRPVMVWLHGGGFRIGTASSSSTDGTRLAGRQDVVVVGINHRLGVFGYLYLAHLMPELADSGNVGNLDMILALQWVRDNIAEFGGDPHNVTVFGESGGGGKVSCMMAMPAAAGLFHKAIQQSGPGVRKREIAEAKEDTDKVLAALKLSRSEVGQLRTMPVQEIIAKLGDAGITMRPVVDGRSLTAHPYFPAAPNVSRRVPLMIGCNKDETALRVTLGEPEMYTKLTWDGLQSRLATETPRLDAPRVVSTLRALYPQATPAELYIIASTWTWQRADSIFAAEQKAAQHGAPAFMYLFAWQSAAMGGRIKASHSIDVPFVFDQVQNSTGMIGTGPIQDKLAHVMSSAWARFARTGNPGWPAYNPKTRATMVFDAESKVVNDPNKPERELFATKLGYPGSCC